MDALQYELSMAVRAFSYSWLMVGKLLFRERTLAGMRTKRTLRPVSVATSGALVSEFKVNAGCKPAGLYRHESPDGRLAPVVEADASSSECCNQWSTDRRGQGECLLQTGGTM
jgi:hypothetical protein